ncbi:MAG: DUF4388 domain-containing protein [Myxococcota bacterium]
MVTTEHILVVDDSTTVRRVVEQALRAAGYAVTTLPSGERALAEMASLSPQLILLDFAMPGMNGYQVAKALAERGELRAPVILMCTRGDQLPEHLLRPLGIVDSITKPFAPEAAVAVVAYALENHGARQHRTSHVAGTPEELRSRKGEPNGSLKAHRAEEGHRDAEDVAAAAAFSDLTRVLADALFTRGIDDADALAGNITEQVRQGLQGALMRELVVRELGPDALKSPMPALYGDLSVVALPEVLQLLKFQGQTGVLEVSLGDARYEAIFRAGRVLSVRSRNAKAALRLGHYFVACGAVSKTDLDELLRRPHGGKAIGERLVEEGLIDQETLVRALGEQAEDLMFEMLRARRGIFGLRRLAAIDATTATTPGEAERDDGPTVRTGPPQATSATGFSVDGLLFESLRRIDEWSVFEKEVPSFDAVFRRTDKTDPAGLTDDETRVLELLRRAPGRKVRELVGEGQLRPFHLCRSLYRLVVLGHVVREDSGTSD